MPKPLERWGKAAKATKCSCLAPSKQATVPYIGEFELNRYRDNYFTDIENAGFSPSNTVPGIGASPDKVL